MKRYNLIYYFLLLAIVMGTFASMAQNSYGMNLMGLACFGFFLVFGHELFFRVRRYDHLTRTERNSLSVELAALCLLSLLFAFRALLIDVPFGWAIIVYALTILALVHVVAIAGLFRNGSASVGILLYRFALLCFVSTFLAGLFFSSLAAVLAIAGFGAAFAFLFIVYRSRGVVTDGENNLLWKKATVGKSGITLIGFGLIFLWFGLRQAGIFPPLYSGDVPPAYVELIRRAEAGEDKRTVRKQYQLFDEEYAKFIQRHKD